MRSTLPLVSAQPVGVGIGNGVAVGVATVVIVAVGNNLPGVHTGKQPLMRQVNNNKPIPILRGFPPE